jgi:hypothetical protein
MTFSFWNALATLDSDGTDCQKIWQLLPDLPAVLDMPTATFEHVNPAWTETLG